MTMSASMRLSRFISIFTLVIHVAAIRMVGAFLQPTSRNDCVRLDTTSSMQPSQQNIVTAQSKHWLLMIFSISPATSSLFSGRDHDAPPDFTVLDDDDDNDANNSNNNINSRKKAIASDFFSWNNDDDVHVNSNNDDDYDDNDDDGAMDTKSRPSRSNSNSNSRGNSQWERDTLRPRRPRMEGNMESSSWMKRNDDYMTTPSNGVRNNRYGRNDRGGDRRYNNRKDNGDERGNDRTTNRTFRQDFRGTRVFVKNLPPDATWQDVKDHFRIAGEVVFASVSADIETGRSKGHGVVQFETTEMAATAIAIMRNHPLDGYQLFVREDIQEKPEAQYNSDGRSPMIKPKKGPTPPTKWKCANEENAAHLSDEETRTIRSLIRARDDARRRREYEVSDTIRDELKRNHNVFVDDRLKMWWTAVDGNQSANTPPRMIQEIKGEGRWEDAKPWRQIPTTPENDACVNAELVQALLQQRDIARKEKDFATADALLEEARTSPDGDLTLRIHDPSRTWRIWTDEPPVFPSSSFAKKMEPSRGAVEQCLSLIEEYEPDKREEVELLLSKFPGREYNILKKLKQKYLE